MQNNEIRQLVQTYMQAWNERDTGFRQELLGQCWGADAVYVDPSVQLAGREALSDRISSVQLERPGSRLEFVSDIDAHHSVVRFLWRVVRADGSFGDTSTDFGEVGLDGRLKKMVGFFGAPPSIKLSWSSPMRSI